MGSGRAGADQKTCINIAVLECPTSCETLRFSPGEVFGNREEWRGGPYFHEQTAATEELPPVAADRFGALSIDSNGRQLLRLF